MKKVLFALILLGAAGAAAVWYKSRGGDGGNWEWAAAGSDTGLEEAEPGTESKAA